MQNKFKFIKNTQFKSINSQKHDAKEYTYKHDS